MKRISIEQAYLWMQGFVQREWRLLLPVALAFLALPPLAIDLLVPPGRRVVTMPPDPARIADLLAWMLPSLALVLVAGVIGGLAVTALALVPRISVREALRVALGRFLVQFGALALLAVALGLAGTVVAAALLALGTPALRATLLVQALIAFGAMFLSVRLMLLGPVVIDRPVGVPAALRAAWAASEGLFWRLFAAAALFVVGAAVVLMAVQWAIGGLLLALGLALGQPELGRALASIASACASAAASTAFTVLVAGLYRQVTGTAVG